MSPEERVQKDVEDERARCYVRRLEHRLLLDAERGRAILHTLLKMKTPRRERCMATFQAVFDRLYDGAGGHEYEAIYALSDAVRSIAGAYTQGRGKR